MFSSIVAMMHAMKILPHLLLAGVLTMGGVGAEPAELPKPPPHKGPRPEFFQEMLNKLDHDGDRAISFEEFIAGERVSRLPSDHQERIFKRLDKNQDGKITRKEMPPMPGMDKAHRKRDLNGDGKVSFEEFQASPRMAKLSPERQREIFNRVDSNQDGFLDQADWKDRKRHRPPPSSERGRPARGWKHLDKNGDGKVNFEEFRQHPRFKDVGEDEQEDRFEALDIDQNGVLEQAEIPGKKAGKKERGGKPLRRKPEKPEAPAKLETSLP